MHASGDGAANNEVDASEVYGDSPNAATGTSAGGTSNFGGETSNVSGSSSTSSGQTGGSAENNNSANNEPTNGADPGVKTEADGSTWTGYY